MKRLLLVLFLFVIIVGIALVSSFHSATGQATTEVKGIIDSNTIWTKVNSPYNFNGPVGISKGVTVTIEPGATINAGYLQVNGTLIARGSNIEPIIFNGGAIELMPTSSGSVIEKMIIESKHYALKCNNVSPTIDNNTIKGAIHINASSPVLSNNIIIGKVSVQEGSPTIIQNKLITDSYGIECAGGSPTITNNIVEGKKDSSQAIGIFGGGGKISNNVISDFQTGVKAGAIIEGNLILNNYFGIQVGYSQTISHNTIINNSEGLYIGESESIIEFNNFQNNSHNFYLNSYATRNITASNNWYGTTDIQIINEKIHNNWKNFDFITVNYVPFLTAPDPKAPKSDVITTISTNSASQTPNSSQMLMFDLDLWQVATTVLSVVIVLLVFVAFYLRKRSVNVSVKKLPV